MLVLLIALVSLYLLMGGARQWRAGRRTENREPRSAGRLIRVLKGVLMWPVDLALERRRLGPRRQRVRLAAAEASEMDPRFAPDMVSTEAEALFRAIQTAWSADDRAQLARLVGKDLMAEWELRLKGFASRGWNNQIEIEGPVHAEYVGLRNAADDSAKRVVVRITARVRDVVIDPNGNTIHRLHSVSDTHHICEYWTLGVSGPHWVLLSIEQHREGLHELSEEILPSPWADTKALQREATVEQAAAASLDNRQMAEIVGATFAGDARAAALDISLVDDRFAPRVLESEVDYAVAAWTEAIDGEDVWLNAVASRAAVQELLYPDDPTCERRLVVRGPRLRSVTIVGLDPHAKPPTMTVELRASGRRYVEDRTTTTVLSGDRSIETSFTLRWRMELTNDDAHPWRIAEVLDNAAIAREREGFRAAPR
ncbi:MAG: hypothetical protein E6G34_10835 [Actinobacteria bacterium]|nr:MAG: hypothetical protein E6G34_10835 [Actinomycetota bacterium]